MILIFDRFLYILFLALDACFRLKRRMISNEIRDPGLGTGWAYVLENAPYQHFLLTVTEQKEVCSSVVSMINFELIVYADEYLQRTSRARLRKHEIFEGI